MIEEFVPVEYKNWTEYYREKNAKYSRKKEFESYFTVAAYIVIGVVAVLGTAWLAAFADFVTTH